MWHAMGCQNGPKNLQGPPKPHFFFWKQNVKTKERLFFFAEVQGHEPLFVGGAIDDKKGMRGHRMGCQN